MTRRTVGRATERARLEQRLDAAAADMGGAVLLVGEPGAGKTHLAELARDEAARRGLEIGYSRGWAGLAPLGLLVEALRSASRSPERLAERLGLHATSVGDLFPELGAAPLAAPTIAARLEALRHLATSSPPTLLCLDDVHEADIASLDMLALLLPRLASTSVLVVLTQRSTGTVASDEALGALGRIARASEVVPVPPLGAAEVATWIEEVAGAAVARETANAIFERTRGNALFVDGVLRARSLALAARPDAALPRDVVDAIDDLIRAVGPDAAPALEVAAVVGRPFGARLLAEVLDRTDAEIASTLEAAARAGVLSHRADTFELAHPIVGEVLGARGSASDRAKRHADVARAIERFEGPAASPSEIAMHRVAAVAFAGVGPALDALARAAAGAGRIHAHGEVVRVRREALRLAELHGAHDRVPALAAALGEALLDYGRRREAREALDRAWIATVTGGAESAELVARIAIATASTGEYGALDREKLDRLQVAAARTEGGTRIRVLARLAAELWVDGGSVRRRDELSTEAVSLARAEADVALVDVALDARFGALQGTTRHAERRAIADELATRAAGGSAATRFAAARRRAAVALEEGDLATYDAVVGEMEAIATALKRAEMTHDVLQRRTNQAIVHGDLERAIELADRARELGHAIENPQAEMGHRFVRGEIAIHRGEHELLADLARGLEGDAERLPHLSFLPIRVAQMLVHAGDPSRAARALATWIASWLPRLPEDIATPAALAYAAETAMRVGDADAARALLPALLPRADGFLTVGATLCHGHASLFIGMLESTLGESVAALRSIERAHREHERIRSPTLVGRSAAVLARLGRASSTLPTALASPRRASLSCEGATWRVVWNERSSTVRDAKGLRLLAALLEAPGQALHVLELVGAGELRTAAELEDAAPLDARAKAAYRSRILALGATRAEAEAEGDARSAARARAELEALEDELSSALGLGGRARKKGAVERARVAVAKSIARAMGLIREADADAAAHLARSVRTGTTCAYDPELPVVWTVRVTS